jgi:hypothetical protein
MCARSWTCDAKAPPPNARHRRRGLALVRKFKGAYSGEHGDGLCRGEWIEWQFGPRITHAFAPDQAVFDPENLLNPQRIVNPPRMDDTRLMRFPPGSRAPTASSRCSRCSTGAPGTCRTIR